MAANTVQCQKLQMKKSTEAKNQNTKILNTKGFLDVGNGHPNGCQLCPLPTIANKKKRITHQDTWTQFSLI